MAEMYVGTIHGFGLDLVRTEVPEFLKYDVLNEVQQVLFVDRNSAKSGLTATTTLQGVQLKRYVDTRLYIEAMSLLRESDVDWAALASTSIGGPYRLLQSSARKGLFGLFVHSANGSEIARVRSKSASASSRASEGRHC